MKKSITVLFVFLLALCGATGAFAQSESDFKVSVANGSVTITKYTGNGGNVVIPARIQGLPVTGIGEDAFSSNASITSVIISTGIKSIGEGAFAGCTKLTGVSIPASVTRIEYAAFSACTALTSVSIPASVKHIGDAAFNACASLASVIMSPGLASIGNRAFMNCTALTSVSIPASVTYIGQEFPFYGCPLTSITISANIEVYDFANNFRDYYNANGKKAGAYTFRNGAWSFKADVQSDFEVTVKNGAVTITKYTGSGGNVVIPATIQGLPVTTIGEKAFYGCTGLTSISIPTSVTDIEIVGPYSDAFYGCSGLMDISVDPRNTAYMSRDGVLFTKTGDRLIKYPAGKKETQYAIPLGVTKIGSYAFEGCSGLTSISILVSVTWIGLNAFEDCTGSIRIGANVVIYSETFAGFNPDPFARCYNTNGRKAGVYTFRNGAWSYAAR